VNKITTINEVYTNFSRYSKSNVLGNNKRKGKDEISFKKVLESFLVQKR